MATSIKTHVEQDASKHTLGHIFAKLNGKNNARTVFVVVEGPDDLEFYKRFFKEDTTSMYYSTKLNDEGNVNLGGCAELQNIVKKVLVDGRSDSIIGIMDTDYRRYQKGYAYPRNIYHTDHRDMEMTVLSVQSVQHALNIWIRNYNEKIKEIEPVLRYVGALRILNDIYRLGCSFKKKAKIDVVFNLKNHKLYPDWKCRFNKKFVHGCFKNKKSLVSTISAIISLSKAKIHLSRNLYKDEYLYDVCQGHDFLKLLSLISINTAVYSISNIWKKCFDEYTLSDFQQTTLYSELCIWEKQNKLSILKTA